MFGFNSIRSSKTMHSDWFWIVWSITGEWGVRFIPPAFFIAWGTQLVAMVGMSWWLDYMISMVSSNFNDSVSWAHTTLSWQKAVWAQQGARLSLQCCSFMGGTTRVHCWLLAAWEQCQAAGCCQWVKITCHEWSPLWGVELLSPCTSNKAEPVVAFAVGKAAVD